VPSDSSELAAALLPVPTAGAMPPFYGTNACSWAEAAGTQRGGVQREDHDETQDGQRLSADHTS
jgi:hypothetical protein